MGNSVSEKPIEFRASNGTVFKSARGDLKDKVIVVPNRYASGIDLQELMSDTVQFASWHVINIHPELPSFSGYDCIHYEIV